MHSQRKSPHTLPLGLSVFPWAHFSCHSSFSWVFSRACIFFPIAEQTTLRNWRTSWHQKKVDHSGKTVRNLATIKSISGSNNATSPLIFLSLRNQNLPEISKESGSLHFVSCPLTVMLVDCQWQWKMPIISKKFLVCNDCREAEQKGW